MDGSTHLDRAQQIASMRRRRGMPAAASKVYAEACRIAWEDRIDATFALELLLLVEHEKRSPAACEGDAIASDAIRRPR